MIVVGFEAVAGAKVITYWFDAPLWLLSLILMIAMTATNLFSVSSFGEFEFWFAGIKVATIIGFLLIGTVFISGLWPGRGADFSNLTSHGGFFPLGIGAIFAAIVVVIFSMVGAEIATIAAAETEDPERSITRATNSVIARIAIFFVGSMFLIAVILPWNSEDTAASPYVAALKEIGIPGADHIMNAVVLTAVLSCLNSGLYTASRMLFVLAARREAPVSLIRVTHRGVPAPAILASSVVGFLCVIAAAISPDTVFSFLLNSSGAIILFVYLLICISQIVLRRRTPSSQMRIKMWAFPFLSIVACLGILGILVQMAFDSSTRNQLLLSLASWGVVLVLYAITKWRGGSVDMEVESPAPSGPAGRVLIMANQTLESGELIERLREIDPDGSGEYFVCVPANPIDTGQADYKGAVYLWEATAEAAQRRLDDMLAIIRGAGLSAEGALGDYRPLRAMAEAVDSFRPDQLVIVTLPPEESMWLRFEMVERAREQYDMPVTHVVAQASTEPV